VKKKSLVTKLRLSKETLGDLDDRGWKLVAGGISAAETDCTFCNTALCHTPRCP